jgi:1-phosphofructokinase family hexose kinase
MGARPQPDFVAVSTNPAIDRVARIEGPARGLTRATEYLETPGGKAIHAACVAAELGAGAAVITTVGGRSGERLLELLASEPLEVVPVPVAGATRGTYTLVGAHGGDFVEVHEPSPPLGEPEAEQLVSALAGLSSTVSVVAVCGSLPPGAPADLHARLVATARAGRAYTILDSSSPTALGAALEAAPDLVAPNLAEASALLGAEFNPRPGPAQLEAITQAIRERGAGAVWLSLGPEGSVFADAEGPIRLTAPASARVVNAVGCGDALIGGFAAGLVAGWERLQAAALGTAAATEKLSHLHPGRVEQTAVEELLPLVDASPHRAEAAAR